MTSVSCFEDRVFFELRFLTIGGVMKRQWSVRDFLRTGDFTAACNFSNILPLELFPQRHLCSKSHAQLIRRVCQVRQT
jgi:hypothetical protein